MNLAPMLVLLIASAIAVPAFSNPQGAAVVNGSATFSQAGNVLTVTNSNGAIINWNKFSIAAGETTHFSQPSASSSVLNRVMSDPTVIYGTLSSNGNVWLVNPSGIMIGAGGRIDTAGFVASTLNVSDEDFLAGRHVFVDGSAAGSIIIQGEITTPAGGSVYLVGANVTNEGIITTPQGEVILTAGAAVIKIADSLPIGSLTVASNGNLTLTGTATGGNLTLIGGGNLAFAGSSSGGSLSLPSGRLAVPAETRKLLQQTAGSIALRGAPSIQTSAPNSSPAPTAPPILRSTAPTARVVNTGSLVDGAVTVRLSLVDASPISLR
ncbi:MAG: filamentous hemagglutinin N-terminal domain-containing protein [Sulfuritalea sp.]|nr:filamentous hemagglutinin N-terminal domain-containing protein [Sulfuritalea sp.]